MKTGMLSPNLSDLSGLFDKAWSFKSGVGKIEITPEASEPSSRYIKEAIQVLSRNAPYQHHSGLGTW